MTAQDLPAQLKLVLNGTGGVAVHPARAEADFDYLYRQDRVLTRDADVAEVRAALAEVLGIRQRTIFTDNDSGPVRYPGDQSDEPGDQPGDDPAGDGSDGADRRRWRPTVPAGLTRLGWQRESLLVPEVLDRLEGSAVARKVTPEHFLYVCGHCCAGKEPELPPPGMPVPYPVAPGTGCGDGHDVSIRVYDTGLVPEAPIQHVWMAGVTGDPDRSVTKVGARYQIDADGGHGTFVSGCIRLEALASAVAVTDMATRTPAGDFTVGVAAEAELARRLVEDTPRPDIIVFSYAGESRNDNAMLAFEVAWETELSGRENLTIVAPAGNDSDDREYWPAAFPWVVGVGALAEDQQSVAGFSNYGPWVDVWAPGENAINAFASGDYAYRWQSSLDEHPAITAQTFAGSAVWSGTSFAAPMVAGMIAARMSSKQIPSPAAWLELKAVAEAQAVGAADPRITRLLRPGQGCAAVPDVS